MSADEIARSMIAYHDLWRDAVHLCIELAEYCHHEIGCPKWYQSGTGATREGRPMADEPCDCGLAELLEKMGKL